MNSLISRYYTAHRDELLAYVSSRLHDRQESEDIVQDVFLRLLTSPKMISEITLPALVYTTLRNRMIDHWRHHPPSTLHLPPSPLLADDRSVESVISAAELTEIMERGLARVPGNCREIYRMHIYGGMKVAEISQTLGEGYKSVEHRLGTARKTIRQYMRRYA